MRLIDADKLHDVLSMKYLHPVSDAAVHANRRLYADIEILNRQPTISNWIPCSEELPEDGEQVLVWYEYFRYGDYNRMYQTYGIGHQYNSVFGGDVYGEKARCIAWMPLPEPYKEA